MKNLGKISEYESSRSVLCHAELLQSCLPLCNPVDCSLPASSVHGILQATIPEWVAIFSSRGSSQPGVKPVFPASFLHCRQILCLWATNRIPAILLAKWYRIKRKRKKEGKKWRNKGGTTERNFGTNREFVHPLHLRLLKMERHHKEKEKKPDERGNRGSNTTLEPNKFYSLRKVRYPNKSGYIKNQCIQEMTNKEH